MPKTKAFEHWSITTKIAMSVALLVALAVAVSLVGLYGLKRMQKAVDTAGQASEVLLSVNAATERVEHFIAARDQDSLLQAKAIMVDTLDIITALASNRPDEAVSLTTGLQRFSEVIDTLRRATEIMDTETSNMTTHHDRLRNVSTEIEQSIEQRRVWLNQRTAIYDAWQGNIQDAHRVLQSIRNGERTATAALAQQLSGDTAVDPAEARDACKALLPVIELLDGLMDAPAWSESLDRLKTAVVQAGQAIGELADAPFSLQLAPGNEALQRLEITYEMVNSLESMVRTKAERVARTMDDLRTETGLLQNTANLSKRFAERVASLEAQTLTFRLLPSDETARRVNDILDQLTRFARILPSAGESQGAASVLTVSDQIDGYRAAFERFRQASKALHQAHAQVRREAARTASLVARFANEQRSVAADNRERGALLTVLTSLSALLIAGLIAWRTSHLIARPIIALAEVMRRLAAGHLEDKIVGLHRGDEIGSMIRAVKVFQENAMRVRALETQAEVERQQILAQLEYRVAERTEALQRKTGELEAQAVELDKARLQAEAATRAKSTFLANMSHELRTPLNAILGYAQILEREADLGERQRSGLNTISQSGRHLLTLINDLLDLSKIEAGKLELYPMPVELVASLKTIADIIRVRVEQKRLTLVFDLPPQLPKAVLLDEKRLRQVLLNLLGNAVKFTDTGQVRLQVQSLSEQGGVIKLRFAVEDSGIGMAPEQLERIFQPFEQVSDIRRRAGGTGLGLVVSRQLVRQMGGDIRVRSTPGGGSRFDFVLSLPIAEVAAPALNTQQEITGYEGARKGILIVDDVMANRTMLADLLGTLGFETTLAADGAEGLKQAEAWRPDLILMDVVMPELDGFEATRRLRQHPELRAIPVIIVSASATDEELTQGKEAGANGYVSKPIERQDLLKQLGELLNLQWVVSEPVKFLPPAAEVEERDWTLPPEEQLEALKRLALIGNMRDIRRWAEQLSEHDNRYRPFADKLTELARAFQSKAILALVESNLKRTSTI